MTQPAEAIEIRARRDADLDACIDIARAVRELDGYPPFLPGDDFRVLLTRPEPLAAYVAVAGSRIVGHVALHASRPGNAVTRAREALACSPAQLGVVARLFSAPDLRRAGIGRVLLHTAAAAARERGLTPILDVWVELHAAIALYDSCGWINLGTVDAQLPDGRPLPEHVFAAP